ncbi:MAG: ORF6N domain-containing protein [Gammaproteobacteria bacterium]|nr:ORF6N domain-containing protein [Gammaproteobacteria bacterium]MBU0814136.1 ORF6N domain-containing protein [Gammaproteobacteria bacterium]MBU1786344.1 ORF6N domain-containing protein [Gammaproteobacteria bacterium]
MGNVNTSSSAEAISSAALSPQALAERILVIRGQRVLLDADLAQLYEVETRVFNQAVKRNLKRFPADFMFQLDEEEFNNLISQTVTSSWGGRRKLPLAFTEHGAIMAASVLNSDRAVEMSVYVVRAFVQLRELLSSHKALADKLSELERRVTHHDNSLAEVINAIRALMVQPKPANRPIGFTADLDDKQRK